MNTLRTVVTGATGFVGRHLLPLLNARGHEVRAALRRPGVELAAPAQGVAVGDIGPDTDWGAALDGADAVVHLAARVHVMKDKAVDPLAAFLRVNTDGTARLAEAAARAGVKRFVYISSIKAVTDESRPDPVSEATPPDPHSPYGVSKLRAEQALATIAGNTGMAVTVLRPPLVYGPGVGGNVRTLMELVARGVPLPLGAVDNRRSLLFVGNLADAIETGLRHPAAAGRTFMLSDGLPLSTPELIRRLAAALGVPARLLRVPPATLALAARLLRQGAAYDRVAGSLVVNDHAIHNTLHWTPPRNAAYGLRATAEWFKASRG